jgi:hypothetical protein
MTIRAIHRLTLCLATLALVAASEANAACADCATVTINANLHITQLHPSVTAVELVCQSAGAENMPKSGKLAVVDRGYAGTVTLVLIFPAAYIVSRPDYRASASCYLWLESSLPPGRRVAIANAAQPLLASDTNWHIVAAGSTVGVAREFTFPNAAAP